MTSDFGVQAVPSRTILTFCGNSKAAPGSSIVVHCETWYDASEWQSSSLGGVRETLPSIRKVVQCLRYNFLCLTGACRYGVRETAFGQAKIVEGYLHQIDRGGESFYIDFDRRENTLILSNLMSFFEVP